MVTTTQVTPQRPATAETPEFCLMRLNRWGEADEQLMGRPHEAYFEAGMADKPTGRGYVPLVDLGGIGHSYALFRNCQSGYWYKCFEGRGDALSDILLAAMGRNST